MYRYSLSELATRALRDAGLIGAEETPSAPDLAWAQETAIESVATMAAEGIRIWDGSEQSVPSGYLLPLSARIGVDMFTSFGLMTPAEAEAARVPLERRLRRISATPSTGEPQKAEYF